MPVTNKGDVQDALSTIKRQMDKGLGIAPRPGIESSSASVVFESARASLTAAITAANNLPNLHRAVAQPISVTSVVTAVLV